MAASDASVFLLAEIRFLQRDSPAAQSSCGRRGFTALFKPASPSALGGLPSGGVAIVAKAELGLVPINVFTSNASHRAIAKAIEAPTLGHVALVAVYPDVSDKRGSGNVALMAQVGAFLTTAALTFVIGGDTNNNPSTCTDLPFQAWLGSVVVAPADGTCRPSAGGWSVIDYAIANASLARFVQSVTGDGSVACGPAPPSPLLLARQHW